MSLELLSQLETKIQTALETIELLKLELDDEREKAANLAEQNHQLKQELSSWNDKITGLVGLLSNQVD
ncbi:cell division protein ZapB [Shewanella litorisediminis]|uniref:Cell division protein ZapB n=1 Tax=Shewanella litorisediminis TaxID=1173586 RepID=A0ABX7G2H1_9GAMM|nr:cell division protein ZapB [Shewanella litorisediminis]MCL2917051.1 cell division protein ZapB [Shewanella litorisediminis]QRH01532.1 cell division protein ZapB [Shewanella litorisediminis]